MTVLGMGYLEILIVLLVAFIFLGPERMVDAARLLGKAVREVRGIAADLPNLDLEEQLLRTGGGAWETAGQGKPPVPDQQPAPADTQDDEGRVPGDAPVAFQPSREENTRRQPPKPPKAPT